jgi:hypothetical protein
MRGHRCRSVHQHLVAVDHDELAQGAARVSICVDLLECGDDLADAVRVHAVKADHRALDILGLGALHLVLQELAHDVHRRRGEARVARRASAGACRPWPVQATGHPWGKDGRRSPSRVEDDQGRRAALRGLRCGPAGTSDDAGPEALDEPVGRAMAMGAGAGPGGGPAGLPAGGPGQGLKRCGRERGGGGRKRGAEFRVDAGSGIWGDDGRGLCRRSARIAPHARRYTNGDLAGLAVRGLGWSPQGRPAAGRSAVHR